MIDYYQILGVSQDASQECIKRAFRRKAKLLHPDMNQGRHDNEYLKVNEAYRVLSDIWKRRNYDLRLGHGIAGRPAYYSGVKPHRYRVYYIVREEVEDLGPGSLLLRIFEKFMFFSLLLIGLFAMGYGFSRFWEEPVEGVNPVNGIVIGVVLTALLVIGWSKLRKPSS